MEIYSLDKSSIKNFASLLSDEARTVSDDIMTLGALEESKPAGILRFYIDVYGNAIILHFCVSPEFRRDYIGMRLFLKLFEILRNSGSKQANCILSREDKNVSAVNFLKKAGFEESDSKGTFMAPLYFWMDSKVLQTVEKKECIKPMESLSKKERIMLFEELFKEDNPGKIGMAEYDDLNYDLSCCFDEDFGKGCILIAKRPSGVLEVIRFGVSGTSKEARMMLIGLVKAAVDRAMDNCEPDIRVMVRCSKDTDRALVEKMWPEIGDYSYIDLIRAIDAREDEYGEE